MNSKLVDGIQNLLLHACKEGDKNTMLQLAQCYREGLGVKKDLEKAAEWYDKAEWHNKAQLIRTYGDDADEHDPDIPF